MQKIELSQRLGPGQEMEEIPDGFDSREVLIGRANPSPFFVIKDTNQVLPYCVINFTRGLTPNEPAPSVPSLPAASSGVISSVPSATKASQTSIPTSSMASQTSMPSSTTASQSIIRRLKNLQTQLQNSMISKPPLVWTGFPAVGYRAFMDWKGYQFPFGVRRFFRSSSISSTFQPWPPEYVSFSPGNHCIISTCASGASGDVTVALRESSITLSMINNPTWEQKVETNVAKLVEIQICVITELRARPDLVSNARLRKIFSRLQHSDVILKPTEKISDVEAELFTLINCHV